MPLKRFDWVQVTAGKFTGCAGQIVEMTRPGYVLVEFWGVRSNGMFHSERSLIGFLLKRIERLVPLIGPVYGWQGWS